MDINDIASHNQLKRKLPSESRPGCKQECDNCCIQKKPKINPMFSISPKDPGETFTSAARRQLLNCKNMFELQRTIEHVHEEIKPELEKLSLIYNIIEQSSFDVKCCKYYNLGNCPTNNLVHHEDKNKLRITSHFCLICKVALHAGFNHPAIDCKLLDEMDKISNLPIITSSTSFLDEPNSTTLFNDELNEVT